MTYHYDQPMKEPKMPIVLGFIFFLSIGAILGTVLGTMMIINMVRMDGGNFENNYSQTFSK